jgi:hypothetical protein
MYLLARDNKSNNGVLLQSSALMSSVYSSHLDEETQMLFIEVCKENTFGN